MTKCKKTALSKCQQYTEILTLPAIFFLLDIRSFWLKFLALCPLLISFFIMAAHNFRLLELNCSMVVGFSFFFLLFAALFLLFLAFLRLTLVWLLCCCIPDSAWLGVDFEDFLLWFLLFSWLFPFSRAECVVSFFGGFSSGGEYCKMK